MARASLNHYHEISALEQSKAGKSKDQKLLIDRRIQNIEIQVLGEQAVCEEESRYANDDERISRPLTEDDFNNGDVPLTHSEE